VGPGSGEGRGAGRGAGRGEGLGAGLGVGLGEGGGGMGPVHAQTCDAAGWQGAGGRMWGGLSTAAQMGGRHEAGHTATSTCLTLKLLLAPS